jgi:hypothetical protein
MEETKTNTNMKALVLTFLATFLFAKKGLTIVQHFIYWAIIIGLVVGNVVLYYHGVK